MSVWGWWGSSIHSLDPRVLSSKIDTCHPLAV
jgi:hypothetical protein